MKKIIFLGLPGAGKGTQAKLLEKYQLRHISTGDLIREAFQNNDPILTKYQKHIDSGGLLPDELIFDLIKKNVQNLKTGYVLDGAVRTLPQAEFAVKNNLANTTVFYTLSQEEALNRLTHRMKNSKIKRKDDNPESFKKRFEEYKTQTQPIINYLKQNTKFFEIDASPSIQEIHEQTKKALEIDK